MYDEILVVCIEKYACRVCGTVYDTQSEAAACSTGTYSGIPVADTYYVATKDSGGPVYYCDSTERVDYPGGTCRIMVMFTVYGGEDNNRRINEEFKRGVTAAGRPTQYIPATKQHVNLRLENIRVQERKAVAELKRVQRRISELEEALQAITDRQKQATQAAKAAPDPET